MNNTVGKVNKTCMTMALEDFYANHNHSTTRIVLHSKNFQSDVVEAASTTIDLLKSVQVQAILGPQRSTKADFMTYIGNKTRVPIISQATSPCLSSMENPYLVQVAQNSSSQVEAITAIFKTFYWSEVVLIYEDSSYGHNMVPNVANTLLNVDVLVEHQSVVSVSATDDHILEELHKLMTRQTPVFVVNMLPALASCFFPMAKQAGMMSKGYVWIITNVLTSLLDSFDHNVISSMQGILDVKPQVPKSKQVDLFNEKQWKRFCIENPDVDRFEVNVFGLWAYDSVHTLARAVEITGIAKKPFQNLVNFKNMTDLATIGTSEMGPGLLQSIRNIRFKGLSGDFHLIDGEFLSSDLQIVNVIEKGEREIGFWTSDLGISRNLKRINKKNYTTNREDLGTIIWPGESYQVPLGFSNK